MKKTDKKVCYIAGAGELYAPLSFVPSEVDYVIAADGGLKYLEKAGIRADLLIGDMDSVDMSGGEMQPVLTHPPSAVKKLPVKKDETDMYAAIQHGLGMGYKTFVIYGGTGGVLRHTIANIQCLKMLAKNGCRGYLIGKSEVLTAIHNDSIEFQCAQTGYLSVFSLGEKTVGITLKDVKFPLNSYTMSDIYPIGVSNEFIGKPATVSVKEGTLLLVYDGNRML